MPDRVVGTDAEDSDAAELPREHPRSGDESTPEPLPSTPLGAIPPSVEQRVVRAQGKRVQPVGPPAGNPGRRYENAAKRLPLAPLRRRALERKRVVARQLGGRARREVLREHRREPCKAVRQARESLVRLGQRWAGRLDDLVPRISKLHVEVVEEEDGTAIGDGIPIG